MLFIKIDLKIMVEQTSAADVQAEAIAKAKVHILQAVEKLEL